VQQVLDLESELKKLRQENEELKKSESKTRGENDAKRRQWTDLITRARESLTTYKGIIEVSLK